MRFRDTEVATPSGSECAGDESVGLEDPESDRSFSDVEPMDGMPLATNISLQEEANSLHRLLNHKPNNPYCESRRRAQMKERRT